MPANATADDLTCVHELVEAHAARTPDAIAAGCGGESISYSELNERANRLAQRLRWLGVGAETLVAVCLPRGLDMPVALLGVLKAGGACVPLNPDYPAARLDFMLADSRAQVLVTALALRPQLAASAATVLCVDEPGAEDAVANVAANMISDATSSSLAYVIYTSGSTGQPKGVMISHASVAHYVDAMATALGVTSDDRWLHTASFAFSSSMRQLLVPLAAGASVVIATADELRDPQLLFQAMRRDGVSIIDVVPSFLRVLTRVLADLSPAERAARLDDRLRLVLSASEPLHADLPQVWAGFGHGARLVNMYGQTETTGIVTTYPITAGADQAAGVVPLGRPIARTRISVLDEAGAAVPTGVTGEICIGGPGVGRGYLDAAATAACFVPDASGEPGARLYRTGDLGRIRADGALEYLGRIDDQVKIRGFRIEPGEVEAALNAHPEVLESAVVAGESGTGSRRLVACVVRRARAASGTDADTPFDFVKRLRDFLKDRLPDYMLPAAVIELPALPRTPHGKLDRRALAGIDAPPLDSTL